MKLIFKQRLFSWLDSYDIYDEDGNTVYTVKGQVSLGHCLNIMDASGQYVGTVKEKVMTFFPKFELYMGEAYMGCVKKEFSLLRPSFTVDFKGWVVEGDFTEWNYMIGTQYGQTVAAVSKQVLKMTDTYVIDVMKPEDAIFVVMLVLAIDAEKCSGK